MLSFGGCSLDHDATGTATGALEVDGGIQQSSAQVAAELADGACTPGQFAYFYRGIPAGSDKLIIDGVSHEERGVTITRDFNLADGDQTVVSESYVPDISNNVGYFFEPLARLPAGCQTFEIKMWAAGGSVGQYSYKTGRGGGGAHGRIVLDKNAIAYGPDQSIFLYPGHSHRAYGKGGSRSYATLDYGSPTPDGNPSRILYVLGGGGGASGVNTPPTNVVYSTVGDGGAGGKTGGNGGNGNGSVNGIAKTATGGTGATPTAVGVGGASGGQNGGVSTGGCNTAGAYYGCGGDGYYGGGGGGINSVAFAGGGGGSSFTSGLNAAIVDGAGVEPGNPSDLDAAFYRNTYRQYKLDTLCVSSPDPATCTKIVTDYYDLSWGRGSDAKYAGNPATKTSGRYSAPGLMIITWPAAMPASSTIELATDSIAVAEATASNFVTVTRTGDTTYPAEVSYTTNAGTATPGSDYTEVSGTLRFEAGETSKTITVPTLSDTVPEIDETLDLQLSNPQGINVALGTNDSAVITILDNDASVFNFSAASYSVAESTATATITVTRTGGSSFATTVDFAIANGTAQLGQDFTDPNASHTLVFAAGVVSRTLTVSIVNDTVDEANETVVLALLDPSPPHRLGTVVSAQLSITDNDNGGTIALGAAAHSVSEAGGQISVPIARTGTALASAVTVTCATADGTAQSPTDYQPVSQVIAFAAGQASATCVVPVADDGLPEGDETFSVVLSAPTGGATLGAIATSTVTILENEATLQFLPAAYIVGEGAASITLTVKRTGALGTAVAVSYTTRNGSALAGSDYTAKSGTLSFAASATSATITVAITNDTIYDPNEAFYVDLSNPTGGVQLGTNSSATVNITNNDNGGTIAFSAATYTVSEATANATITVSRTGSALASGVTVSYETGDGTATVGADYTATSGTLTFGAGVTSQSFTIPIDITDAIDEPNETVLLTLSTPTGGAGLGSIASAVLTINDNDTPGTIAFSAASYNVSEGAAAGTATLTVSRTGTAPLASAVSIDYATSDGTALAGVDYSARTGTLQFAAGQATATIVVPIVNDAVSEGTESFRVELTNPTGGASLGANAIADVNVLQDETTPAVQIAKAAYAVTEGTARVTLTIQRTCGAGCAYNGNIVVRYATLDGTAVTGTDYVAKTGSVTLNSTTASANITITITNDALVEAPETFGVQLGLTSPLDGRAVLGTNTLATVTIISNE